jgi:3-(methylthio)propionyl---CoA ligase
VDQFDRSGKRGGACAGVKTAAAVGVPHPKWEERPLLILELNEDALVNPDDVMAHLATKFAKWQLPEEIVIDKIPLTATGKIDKKELRRTYATRYT